ncbi:MAG: coniferyl aldehyde dehydrogenase [Betaproteobacteria bacterium]|nr:coniferyl aldehyde dehydrogenase [Betaproteobacteria bacterium]
MDLSHPSPLTAAFASAQAAYEAQRNPDLKARRAHLKTLERLLLDNQAALAAAISADFSGRSTHETELLEFFPSLGAIRHASRHLRAWMKPKRSWASLWFLPARNEIRPQPLGVVGIIVPWNYPILLAVSPLVGALAAGNQVLIKMSEFTPQTGALFAELIHQAFPRGQVRVINGGADVAEAFSALPFDHLLFTGSTAVGHHVMRAAATNLTPVTLELGGKSPALVGPECDMREAAEKILFGKCLNAGQTCIAPDYALLPAGSEQTFLGAAKAVIASLYPTLAANPDYTSIINPRHHDRLMGYLADAAAKGATITPVNPAREALDATQKIAPTLVTGVSDDMRLMQDEIFGPILPIKTYSSLDEAIAYINRHPRPLALYYFGRNRTHINHVLDNTVAGGVTLNDTILHISQDQLPFGGVGPAGMGAYHGRYGFETFSHMKPIFDQPALNGLGLFKPPYGKRFEALVKLLLRF